MKEHQKEIIKLTAGEVLLRIFDLAVPFFEADRIYRVSAQKYKEQRDYEKSTFRERIKYLKRQGLINHIIEGKDGYFEITAKGLTKINKFQIDEIVIKRPKIWDKKWRVVIFDILEKHKTARNILRAKLIELGFEKIQESVYVYPFDCTEEITQLSYMIGETENILIMISEIIQGENTLIENFFRKNVLQISDLK